MFAQPAHHALGRAQFLAGMRLLARLRMHQERGAPVQIRAHDVDAALGFVPVVDDDVLQLLVQELFGGLFVGRVHFHEVRQHARPA